MPTFLKLCVPIEAGDPLNLMSSDHKQITDSYFDASEASSRMEVVGSGDISNRRGEKIEVSLNFSADSDPDGAIERLIKAIREHRFPISSRIIKISKTIGEVAQSETVYEHQ